MTVTYQHNADPSMDNPAPLTHDALASAGVLEVDYQDGSTRRFDVDTDGTITPRKYAYACALVIETDEPRPDENGGEDWHDSVLTHIGRALPAGFPGEIVYCSTPHPRPLSDSYGDQPTSNPRRLKGPPA